MRIHIVQKGDTLWKIAQKYNVDFAQLKSLNSHLSDPNMIMPGMKIKVPTGHGSGKKPHKEKPIKEAPIKEAPIKEAPIKESPVPIPPPMPELPKYPIYEESSEFLPPLPEAELPIETPPVPMPTPMPPYQHQHQPMPPQHMPAPPCGCAPIMPMPCQPIHWPCHCHHHRNYGHHHGYGHHQGYGHMMPSMPPMAPMGAMEGESSSSSYDTYYESSPMYGSQPPMAQPYGPPHGGQMYDQHQGMHHHQMPMHGQHQGMYGQQMPMHGQHQGMYGQQMPYAQAPMQPFEQPHYPMMPQPNMPYDQQMMPVPPYQAPMFSGNEGPYREADEDIEEDED